MPKTTVWERREMSRGELAAESNRLVCRFDHDLKWKKLNPCGLLELERIEREREMAKRDAARGIK